MHQYRFHQFKIPTHDQFADPNFRWFNIVGDFIAPIVVGEEDLLYWFCYHNPDDFQFCFWSENHDKIEQKIADQKKEFSIETKSPPTENAKIEFRGQRWIAPERTGKSTFDEDKRAELILRCLHATCVLFIDSLIKDGGNWRLERNAYLKENPCGNSFESLLHLISNISRAKFDVYLKIHPEINRGQLLTRISGQTLWMSQPVPISDEFKINCNL